MERRMMHASLAYGLAVAMLWWSGFVVPIEAVERYELPVISTPPVIDGKLDDPCWREALILSDFAPLGGKKVEGGCPATKAMLFASASSLYVGVLCEEPLIDRLLKRQTAHDSEIWLDDDVELFVVPGVGGGYIQVAVNPLGVLCDAYFPGKGAKPEMDYESGAVVKADIGARGWSIEVEIPLAKIPVQSIQGTWSFHIARGRKAAEMNLTCLKTPVAGFHAVEAFAELVGIEKLGMPFCLKNFSFGKLSYGENCCAFEIEGAKEKLTSAEIEVGGATRATFDSPALAIQTGTLRLPFVIQQADVGKRLVVRAFCGTSLIQERGISLTRLPTELLGKPKRTFFYFSANDAVELAVPVNVSGARGEPLKLVWTAVDADGKNVGGGETLLDGMAARLRLYWEKWQPGVYDVGLTLHQGGKAIAATKQSIHLIPNPWEEE